MSVGVMEDHRVLRFGLTVIVIFLLTYEYVLASETKNKKNTQISNSSRTRGSDVCEDKIYFVETASKSLTPRQACSIESAVRANPNFTIEVIFVSEINENKIMFKLLKRKKVIFKTINLTQYFIATPLKSWWATKPMEKSPFTIHNLSDVLRLLTLWKYGGYYIDMDVVVTRSFSSLGCNWVSYQDESTREIGNAVLSFNRDSTGLYFTRRALREIRDNFPGDIYGHNGPALLRRVLDNMCTNGTYYTGDLKWQCKNIRILPQIYFFSIAYSEWKLYFTAKGMERVKMIERVAYGFHIWNTLSADGKTPHSQDSPYKYLSNKYCPEVYALSKSKF